MKRLIHWRDIKPGMTVIDTGKMWTADGRVVFWHSHEAQAAHYFLKEHSPKPVAA